ncbi:putative scytalone dehydratase [Beauveria bassiana D1-5]|uniref:Putative scytalone dehydratase n=1 Tax=Beauveria bassiana D1-5 TaxID=1245745 RepID=A0A0A2V9T3_BEABA|nr:putative scytalone dehydratase [Beauveria bassiana D1-5]
MTFSSADNRAGGSSNAISFQEYLDDWSRLRSIIAPTLYVDYSKIGKAVWETMPADDFIAMVSDGDFLGDPCVKTQHLLGASRWERISETEIVGHHQLRAAHQSRYEQALLY